MKPLHVNCNMKQLCLLFIAACSLVSCEKAKFKNDECHSRCHILSGYVYEYGTSNPINQVELKITAKKKKNTKYIVSTKTDNNGFWKMSFKADYIDNLKEGYIEIDRKNYLFKKERMYFNIDSMDIEQKYEFFIHKTAEVYFTLSINNPDIKRIESRYVFENQGFKELKYTNKEVPSNLSFRQEVPADQDVRLSIWTSLEANASKDNDWLKVIGFDQTVNISANSTDTIEINFK